MPIPSTLPLQIIKFPVFVDLQFALHLGEKNTLFTLERDSFDRRAYYQIEAVRSIHFTASKALNYVYIYQRFSNCRLAQLNQVLLSLDVFMCKIEFSNCFVNLDPLIKYWYR